MIHLAFDLGASSGKLLAGKIENSKIVLDEIHRFENGPCRLANGLYWNFMGIYSSLISGLKKARGQFGSCAGTASRVRCRTRQLFESLY